MTTDAQVRHHLAAHLDDVARWREFADELTPSRAAAVWLSRLAADTWRDLRAWGPVGPRGVG